MGNSFTIPGARAIKALAKDPALLPCGHLCWNQDGCSADPAECPASALNGLRRSPEHAPLVERLSPTQHLSILHALKKQNALSNAEYQTLLGVDAEYQKRLGDIERDLQLDLSPPKSALPKFDLDQLLNFCVKFGPQCGSGSVRQIWLKFQDYSDVVREWVLRGTKPIGETEVGELMIAGVRIFHEDEQECPDWETLTGGKT